MNNEEMPKIFFAKTNMTAIIPSKEEENAGYDIYACWDEVDKRNRVIRPHSTKLIPTGVACALPIDYYFQVEERGSTGSKGIKKSAGVIDSGYRGEIFIAISNVNDKYLIFGDKQEYLEDSLSELRRYQEVDVNHLTEWDIEEMKNLLVELIGNSYFSLSNEEKMQLIINTYNEIKNEGSLTILTNIIEDAIFYPSNKAIAQLVLHKVDNLPVEEIDYEELTSIPSIRGTGILGSSGK